MVFFFPFLFSFFLRPEGSAVPCFVAGPRHVLGRLGVDKESPTPSSSFSPSLIPSPFSLSLYLAARPEP